MELADLDFFVDKSFSNSTFETLYCYSGGLNQYILLKYTINLEINIIGIR